MTTAIYLFVDALGWELVQKHHFLEKELPFRYPVKMQFGYSSTAVPTILTGVYPREHNHFSFFYYDPQHSPFKIFRFVKYFGGAGLHPRCLLNRGRVRGYISKLFAACKGYTGYFQLYSVPFEKLRYFNYCEKNDIFAPKGIAPIKNIRDVLDESPLRFHISNWRFPESKNMDNAQDSLINNNLDFAFIYTAQLDGFLHNHISDNSAIATRLKQYESRLKQLLDSLKAKGIDYHFTIISDHGMTPLKGTCNLMEKIQKLELKFGSDYVAVYDSTMARFWYLKPSAKGAIHKRLSRDDCMGNFVSESEKKQYGIDFHNNLFGEDIFLMNVGVQIVPCDLGYKPLNGMHGFSPEDKDSYASFLSTHPPRFRPQEIKDFFHLMKSDIDEMSAAQGSR